MTLLAPAATAGFLNLPTCDGPPTGTPTNLVAGQSPAVFDQINGVLWVYSQPLQKWLGADMPYPMAAARGHVTVAPSGLSYAALGTLLNHYDPELDKTIDTGGISQWDDQASAQDLSQLTSGQRPDDAADYIDFDSANNDQLTSTEACHVGGSDFTIIFDMYFKDDAIKGLMSVDEGANPSFLLTYWKGVNGLILRTYNPIDSYQTIDNGGLSLANSVWHQFAIRYDHSATTLELLVNNTVVASSTARTIALGTDRFRVSTQTAGYSNINARVGRILVYSSWVNDAGLAAIYAQKHA